jgi:hypothetical protein
MPAQRMIYIVNAGDGFGRKDRPGFYRPHHIDQYEMLSGYQIDLVAETLSQNWIIEVG